jgi:hypothetical protein
MAEIKAFLVTSQSSAKLGWVGNDGYSDDLNSHYSFDSKVANGKNITIGSYLVLKRDGSLVGIGLVHALEVKNGIKTLRKCPSCDKQALEKRKQGYRCTSCNGMCTEDQIRSSQIEVSEFRATYKNAWNPATRTVKATELEQLLDKHDIQSAIRSISRENLISALNLIGFSKLPDLPSTFL